MIGSPPAHHLARIGPDAGSSAGSTRLLLNDREPALPGPALDWFEIFSGDGPIADDLSTLDDPNRFPHPDNGRLPIVPGYRILGEIGRGGMGVVYKALQVRLNRTVALKMLLANDRTPPETAIRFLAEAEALARFEHPNVLQVHRIDTAAGQPYLELEYAAGGCLARRLVGRPLPSRAAAAVVEPVARGVAEAHRAGIIHRDLKPSNILLTGDGVPKIADFGLAKLMHVDTDLTLAESVLGSPCYMSPEQAEGTSARVGPASDVYSLGAILYELLTGRPPFRGATVLETLALVKSTEPVPPSTLVPGISRDIDTICLTCLRKDPAQRFASADALADDLRRYLEGRPISSRPHSPMERLACWRRRNRLAFALILALGGLLVTVASASVEAAYWFRRLTEVQSEALAETDRQAHEAEAVLHLFLREILPGDVSASYDDRLAAAGQRVRERYAGDPRFLAAVLQALAELEAGRGRLDRALGHAREALDLRTRALGPGHRDTVASRRWIERAGAIALRP